MGLVFLNKYMKDGDIVAWKISDDDIVYDIAAMGVYSSMFFERMISDGYKFKNYNLDIVTPDGFDLRDVAESPSTNS